MFIRSSRVVSCELKGSPAQVLSSFSRCVGGLRRGCESGKSSVPFMVGLCGSGAGLIDGLSAIVEAFWHYRGSAGLMTRQCPTSLQTVFLV